MDAGRFRSILRALDRSREESRERFEESLEIIKQAWTNESFSYDGSYYTIPETSVVPKPLQQPHPPIRIAATARRRRCLRERSAIRYLWHR